MTTRTRRTLLFSLVVLSLVLPAEAVLLKALQSPSDTAAAKDWVSDLDSAELTDVASRIQSYPFLYRREIMRGLTADARAKVWRAHISGYIRQHPELNSDVVTALKAAVAVTTPELMSGTASKAASASAMAVAGQVEALLGTEKTKEILYNLGPVDGTFASREPLVLKLASFVRKNFVVLAQADECDCVPDFGCDVWGLICSTQVYCAPDVEWPKCGWWWYYECTALCR